MRDSSIPPERRYNARPMTLYVSLGGISEIDLDHIGVEAERVIDIELSKEDTTQLLKLLEERIKDGTAGTVTFRLRGRLVL